MTSTERTPSTPATQITDAVWPCLSFNDAHAAIDWLVKAFGLEERARYAGEGDDATTVHHAEVRWPLGGGVMLGSPNPDPDGQIAAPPGTGCVYLVTEHPDALFERCTAAGAAVVKGLADEDYGSRGFTVRDPEGNRWSFGTYRGE
jgi:uncharacterized glyoxalase superfamily protein PhnB